MKKRYLEDVVIDIEQACKVHNKNHKLPAFSIVVGAGISCPQVPLSNKIKEECKEIIRDKREKMKKKMKEKKEDDILMKKFDNDMIEYFELFYNAFKEPELRWNFFKEKLWNTKISIANLLLANLLKKKKIASTVITPNFDDFLSRSLYLYQVPHIVIDHPGTINRFDLDRDEIQIIHVHGSYKFLDLCNTEDDVLKRAKKMARPLKDMLINYPPIVIGYSGWEADCIMKGLNSALNTGQLKQTVYWFCYESSVIENLPSWLKEKKSESKVVFVIPEKGKFEYKVNKGDEGDKGFPILYKKETNGTLSAKEVFEAFHRIFKISLPECIIDPIGDYEKLLECSFPYNEKEKSIYPIYESLTEVHSARGWDKIICPKIKRLISLKDNSKYKEVLEISSELSNLPLKVVHIEKILKILESLPSNCIENKEVRVCIENIFSNLFRNNKYYFESEAKKINALISKGKTIGNICSAKEALIIYTDIVIKYSDSTDPEIQDLLIKLFECASTVIPKIVETNDKLDFFDNLSRHYFQSKNPVLHVCNIKALYRKGIINWELGNSDEAIFILDEIINLYGGFGFPDAEELVVRSFIEKGKILRNLNRIKEAHVVFEEVEREFEKTESIKIKSLVKETIEEKKKQAPIEKKIESHMNTIKSGDPRLEKKIIRSKINLRKVIEAFKSGENDLYLLDRFVKKYGDIKDASIQEFIARALIKKGVISCDYQDELNAYNEVINRFKNSEREELRRYVIRALLKKISSLELFADDYDSLAEAYFDLAEKFAEKKDKKGFLKNLNNALEYGTSIFEVKRNKFFKEYENDDSFKEIIEKFENESEIELKNDENI